MATYLSEILVRHRAAAEEDQRAPEDLLAKAQAAPGATRGFRRALQRTSQLSVIAEIKRRSPSKGPLAPGLDPAHLARSYQRGGARCLSVLTDAEFFGGSSADLEVARAAVDLPVLRKDFTVCPADVADARLMGADAVLLIVAALSDVELAELARLVGQLGMDALVEVHDEDELERALSAGAELIGVNQRDLATFEVDRARAERVGRHIPETVVAVAESGITETDDVRRLADAGFRAILVGETLVRAEDPVSTTRALSSLPLPLPLHGVEAAPALSPSPSPSPRAS